jgi:hypothetical protein
LAEIVTPPGDQELPVFSEKYEVNTPWSSAVPVIDAVPALPEEYAVIVAAAFIAYATSPIYFLFAMKVAAGGVLDVVAPLTPVVDSIIAVPPRNV